MNGEKYDKLKNLTRFERRLRDRMIDDKFTLISTLNHGWLPED